MNFSVYDLDAETQALLSLDNFLGKLTVNQFVERLLEDHRLKQDTVQNLAYLDPKPYIRTFESTLRQLHQKSTEITTKQQGLEQEVREQLETHNQTILGLSSLVQRISSEFGLLDGQVSQVIAKIGPLGDRLTRLTLQRDRAIDTGFLLRCYKDLYDTGSCATLVQLRSSSDHTQKMACATTVRQLLVLARALEGTDGANAALAAITTFGIEMEEEYLELFQELYASDHFEIMADIALVLVAFNGGASAINAFLDHNAVFNVLDAAVESSPLWEDITSIQEARPAVGHPEVARLLGDVLGRVKTSIKMNARITRKVFGDQSGHVMTLFLQRLSNEVIGTRVARLLKTAAAYSHLAYVKLVHACHVVVGEFVRDLKEFFVDNDLELEEEMATTLDACYTELFHEYLRDDKFFGLERKTLEEIISTTTHAFALSRGATPSSGLLGRIQEHTDEGEFNYDEFSPSPAKGSTYLFEAKKLTHLREVMKAHLDRTTSVRGVTKGEGSRPLSLAPLTFNIDTVTLVLGCAKEAVARLLELSPSVAKSCEYVGELLKLLLVGLGESYLDVAFENSYNQLKHQETLMLQRPEVSDADFSIDLEYLQVLAQSLEVVSLVSTFASQVVVPVTINSPATKDLVTNCVNAYIAKCEISVNILLKDTLLLVNTKVGFILTHRQKKKDFAGNQLMNDDTVACELLGVFLAGLHERASPLLLGERNTVTFFSRVGTDFLQHLLQHFTKFQVSETGALILTKDVVQYQNLIATWKIDSLTSDFEILKEVASLFSVNVELLESLIQEGKMKRLSRNQIDAYIQKRADLSRNGVIQRLKSMRV